MIHILTEDEKRIIVFGKAIQDTLTRTIRKLKKFIAGGFDEIRNIGYFEPKNHRMGIEKNKELRDIFIELANLKYMIGALFRLERKV